MNERISRNSPEFEDFQRRAIYLRTEHKMTVEQIANEMCISPYQVRGLLVDKNGRLPRKHKYKPIYPNLEHWAISEYASISACARALGIRNTLLEAIVYWGGEFTRKVTIDKILELSGLTYEEAFKEDDGK